MTSKSYECDIFEEIHSQEIAISLLKEAIDRNHLAPAYLFIGPKGVGQKKTALRFIEGLTNSNIKKNLRSRLERLNHPDLIWVEPTYLYQGRMINKQTAKKENLNRNIRPQIRLEQIKEIKTFLSRKPLESNCKIVVIEDVETINESAGNALLKTLEEPSNGILILICERREKIINTIVSRCQVIPFKPFNVQSMEKILSDYISEKDVYLKINNQLEVILKLSKGSPELLQENISILKEIPIDILEGIEKLPKSSLDALLIAKKITDELSSENQLWLINWLQQSFWIESLNPNYMKKLEKLRFQLLRYVNPRIAWEVTLIELAVGPK